MTIDDPPLTVICFQLPIDHAPAERLDITMAMMTQAHDRHGPGLYVFPEYALNHLCADPADTTAQAQTVPGATTEILQQTAATLQSTIAMGMLERSGNPDAPFNTVALIGPDRIVGCYRKTHLWDLGPQKEAYRECKLFTPGDTLEPFDIGAWKIGVMICADGVFPEVPRTPGLERGASDHSCQQPTRGGCRNRSGREGEPDAHCRGQCRGIQRHRSVRRHLAHRRARRDDAGVHR